jgi:hypothetical protein
MAGLKPWDGIAPTGVDPIFAAIEQHRRAWQRQARIFDEEFSDEKIKADAGAPWWSWGVDDPTPPSWASAENIRVELAVARSHEELDAAALALLDVMPTTVAGVAALLRYSATFDETDCWPCHLYDDANDLPLAWDELSLPQRFKPEQEGRWHNWLQRHAANALDRIA